MEADDAILVDDGTGGYAVESLSVLRGGAGEKEGEEGEGEGVSMFVLKPTYFLGLRLE